MDDNSSTSVLDGEINGIRFGLATRPEIRIASNSDFPISHASQLTNPFLGLPLESGKCESCGTAEPGKCDGHFGYIELPIPIYHPCHVSELRRMLSILCLKCLKIKKNRFLIKSSGVSGRVLNASASCCEDLSQVSIKEVKTTDGACYLELKLPSRSRIREGFWNFLERYGFRYGDTFCRPLLPSEVMEILKKIPVDTRKKLVAKGYFPQDGYILQYLPVPPNCLSIPDVSDGISVMSSDLSLTLLKKVLKQVEIIKCSRSGTPNFESHEIEANDLQSLVSQYLKVRGTAKTSRDVDARFGISKEPNNSSTKAWLEKMRTLFIRKGSGFSSRSVITGDAYKGVNEIGIPFEIAQRITFEEKVSVQNMNYLQKLVDDKLCLTYKDGLSTYSLKEGSKGHTFLRPGQVVHRRIMDGDIVFINRPPTTHKHSLQAFSVYVHDDHTVKINPLICGPLGADFDGDCVHLFYPQSLAAKAEVVELFSVDKQLLSSHSGSLNLQITTDSLLSLKSMFKTYFLNKAVAQQLGMFVSTELPPPALLKAHNSGPLWTALQMLQTVLPGLFDCSGEKHLICKSKLLKLDLNRDELQSLINEIVSAALFDKGPKEVLNIFNSLQPLLMEHLFSEGFTVGLYDFCAPRIVKRNILQDIQDISPLLYHLRSTYNELLELQLENHIRQMKVPIANFILTSSALGILIDSKSDSSINKVVQQIGFLGLQLSDKGKFYSRTLVEDMASLFKSKCPFDRVEYPSGEYGLVKSCFFHGLDPYEEMVHSISSREVLVRSSRGLSEPGTLFKNLMAILRDVVICYDGTVRNVCSNSIIQFEYGVNVGVQSPSLFPAGEPVGVLAATAMSNPAYKAVLDSSPSSNSSWELMKEILLSKVSFKNDLIDRRVILYLNGCDCGRLYCREKAAYLVKNQLKKVSLKDTALDFMIEYKKHQSGSQCSQINAGLVGHIHLNEILLKEMNLSMPEVLQKCQETIISYRRKKKAALLFKRVVLFVSECCSMPCLAFFLQDMNDSHLERTSQILSDTICPVLLETIVKGDPRVCSVNIIWISPDSTTWIRNPSKTHKGELALDVVLEKAAVKQSGDVWRIVMDSCIPIIHLIDTRRSIPYAIKQVQDLLGISCAFEQAVQRLSTSVAMVAKGVLKEHLILLANSMTCAGNLVGFNVGGYKTLSRSLNIQVPFTEATLFTPRKCFERAAEKCHVDSLSSIVASCSWGKHVAVGTGSRFDILWDKKEMGVNQEDGIDVYSFLHLVRGGSIEGDSNTACLGAEIDDLMLDDEHLDFCPSPDNGFEKPVFEENSELPVDQPEGSSWDSPNVQGWNESQVQWGLKGETASKREPKDNSHGWGQGSTERVEQSQWGQGVSDSRENQQKISQSWGQGSSEGREQPPWGQQGESASKNDWKENSWGQGSIDRQEQSLWGQKGETGSKKEPKDNPRNWGQGSVEREEQSPWGQKEESTSKKYRKESGWAEGSSEREEQPQWGQQPESSAEKNNNGTSYNFNKGWNERNVHSQWGQQKESSTENDPIESSRNCSRGLNENEEQSQWGQQREVTAEKDNFERTRDWDSSNELNQPESSQGWGSPYPVGGNESETPSQWGGSAFKKNRPENSRGWGSGAGDWKNKNRPAKSPRIPNDDSSASGIYTATRQRLDMFTSEEQDILSDVEPVMRSLRRIMHQSRYNDGDPLSAEDQSFVLENVFNHHPDKEVKMGAGIDYLMVSKHSSFQESRCFYIVSTDGRKEDFSYRKCLENFIKGKYPDLAEPFIGKYFRRPRPGGNREWPSTQEENGA
ncbi:DNA-directed RNA polymerase V subunit 1 [Malania oleifera]|uniref:DNA-directed RNA polymerase V subunit 1 n=1 Tax=Malania oleifera TaxID=397392 RepID=UPI0025ADC9F2|nr:DNA-directed RNA polymerase V subunit 1 [Malania oleifera]XP_057977243.1 DNA-directed RNA polymerase V subunit 1 [Malania oleifera]XP_057977244.1 DNA-directed RNA polymerase V subunit 1 [Malania oleifera]